MRFRPRPSCTCDLDGTIPATTPWLHAVLCDLRLAYEEAERTRELDHDQDRAERRRLNNQEEYP